ncbi:AcrB [uncultured Alphaproteobacteria bacterium]|uniref:AcrB n=1 Tax=uncultured Alphaproteobacteria bacterium TaxID=91750 RepID=A0A212JNF0_9PROT|nr:AcrB [uncultured Alphaproteobacteria bacterium]
MNALIDAALARSRTVLLTLALTLIAGLYAYVAIPKESSPDVNIPIMYVLLTHRGISPEDAERMLVRPMERELRSIEGIKEMRATAYEGGANVILEFDAGFDADTALADVRAKVDIAKSDLPSETEEPEIHEVNVSLFPVLLVTLSGHAPERTLVRLARDLKDEIEAIPAVLEVNIGGDREDQVEIVVDPAKVESYNLVAQDITGFLARSNKLVAAGAIDTGRGRFAVKVPGVIETVQEIMTLPVKASGDGVVRLSDIASVRKTFKDPTSIARVNGEPSVTLEVSKRTGENIIDTIDRVRAVVTEEQAFWPANVRASFSQDQSDTIRSMLSDLQNNVIAAIVLVMVVVVAALGVRSGLLVGVAIPGSFLAGILVLFAMGMSMNLVVLFSLILATGMLVDGAIIVVEYADRKMAEGVDRRQAYRLAALRMAWPVIASTATTVAAFLPMVFWTGIVGEFMKYLPITLTITLTASLLMALVFVPSLGALFGRPGEADPDTLKALSISETGDLTALAGWTGRYTRLLSAALDHAGWVVAGGFAVLVASWAAYAAFGRGVEFFPDIEPKQAVVYVHARGNMAVAERDRIVREVERRVMDYGDAFDTVYARAGQVSDREAAEDVIGAISLEFKDWQLRRPASAVFADIRAATADLPGIMVEIRKKEEGPPVGKPVRLQLASRDPARLPPAVEAVRRGMAELGGFIDVEDNRPLPGIQWEVAVDRAQAAKFGVDVTAVGDMVQLVTQGLKLSDYRPDDADDEVDIVVRYPVGDRTVAQLGRLRVETAGGAIPIAGFVEVAPKPRTGTLNRVDAKRVMTVRADVEPGLLVDDQVTRLRTWIAANPLPRGVTATFKGQDEEQQKSRAFLGRAFLIALFLIAMILVTQFDSFYSAALVLTAVLMSTIGVMLGLLITHQPFGVIMSGIGVVSLAGIVVNNNIVLIDTFDRLTREIPDVREAILRTGAQRLRPVMLTTGTTILGLLPMMFMVNIDFVARDLTVGAPSMQWWTQLSTGIVFGLGFATLLTLVVTPCALMLRGRLAARFGRLRARLRRA